MNWINVIGYTAGVLTAVTFLPQVIKTWKMKAAGELSFIDDYIGLMQCFHVDHLWLFVKQ